MVSVHKVIRKSFDLVAIKKIKVHTFFLLLSKKTMPLSFLQNLLPDYSLVSLRKNMSLFIKEKKEPAFCLLPRLITPVILQKTMEIQVEYPFTFWILPKPLTEFLLNKNPFFQILQPLYFLQKEAHEFVLYDKRFLKLHKKLYKLPPLRVQLFNRFSKEESLKDTESSLLFPKRNNPFYCKGDSSERLLHPSYLKSLITRKNISYNKENRAEKIYFVLKKLIDV